MDTLPTEVCLWPEACIRHYVCLPSSCYFYSWFSSAWQGLLNEFVSYINVMSLVSVRSLTWLVCPSGRGGSAPLGMNQIWHSFCNEVPNIIAPRGAPSLNFIAGPRRSVRRGTGDEVSEEYLSEIPVEIFILQVVHHRNLSNFWFWCKIHREFCRLFISLKLGNFLKFRECD